MIWHVFLTDISRQESIWIAIANSVLQLPTSPLGVDKMEAMEAFGCFRCCGRTFGWGRGSLGSRWVRKFITSISHSVNDNLIISPRNLKQSGKGYGWQLWMRQKLERVLI